ncbi:iron-siderophore ABC transporter substrate-binding protein [Streptomyces capparidis]
MHPIPLLTRRVRRTARRLPAIAVAAALTFALAACGSDDDGADSEPAAEKQTSAGAFPVTIKHVHGSTTVKKQPQRVVTVGLSDQDAALALGVKPVGVVDWLKERPYGKWPWTKELWGDTKPTIVGEREDFKYEKIIALKPDLILALYTGIDEEKYKTLSAIAPTVAWNGDHPPYGAPWQDMTLTAGKALGKEAEAKKLVEGIDQRFAKAREEHPEFAGQTAVVADTYKPGEYSAFAPHDPKSVFVKELGFKLSPEVEKLAGKENAATVGSERLDLLDVDRLIWLNWDASSQKRIEADKVYKQLKVVKDGRDLFLPYFEPPVGAAITYNTVLSIPWAIDQMVPMLAKK